MACSLLSLDILGVILEQLRSTSPEDLKVVSLCNKEIYQFSLPFLHYALSVNQQSKERARSTWAKLEGDQDLQGYVKELTLRESRWASGRSGTLERSGIESLLEIASQEHSRLRLKTFTWHVSEDVDLALLANIDHIFPDCAISLERYTGKPIPFIRNLVALDSTVHLSANPLGRFNSVFANAPTLQKLHIKAYVQSGCVIRSYPEPEFLNANTPCAARPKLHELSLRNFNLRIPDSSNGLVDWSLLHTLRLDLCYQYGAFLESISTQLTSLRNLSLHDWRIVGDDYHTLSSILQCFPHSLEKLDLAGPYLPLLDTIGRYQGQSLRKLSLHMQETYRDEQRQVMTASQFKILVKACCNLEWLQVDVEKGDEFSASTDIGTKESHDTRVGPAPVEIIEGCDLTFLGVHSILSGLETLPNLQSLRLYTLLGIRQCKLAITREEMSSRMLPFLDFFPLIAQFSVIQGEPRQMGGGYPASWVMWESNARCTFHFCKESEDTVKATEDLPLSAYYRHSQSWTIYKQEHGKWSVGTTFVGGDAGEDDDYL